MEEDYKPGQLPYPEQDDRKKFFQFHYKGVLIILIPLLFCPILLGPETLAYRMIYLTVCIYLYYIFNVMSQGAIAFLFIVFMPLCGISPSKTLCTSHYSDLIFETYGCVFIGIAMDSSRLSERYAIQVIKITNGNLRFMQIIVSLSVLGISLFCNSSFTAAIWMKVMQAIVTEYSNAGLLTPYSEEETYERQDKPYPSWPVIGLFLTVCYSANLGNMIFEFSNPNSFMASIFKIFLPKSNMGFGLVCIIPVILGLIVIIIWINVIFLGLLSGQVGEQVKAATDGREVLTKAVSDKKEAMGPYTVHQILVTIFLLIAAVLIILRRPNFSFVDGWADKIHLVNCGSSLAIILVCVLLFSIPANYYFCRYYVCRQPEKPGTVPSLVLWKACNSNTPWAHIFMLAAGHGFAVGLHDSKLLEIIQNTLVRKRLDVGYSLFIGSLMAAVFAILAPATTLARYTLLTMFRTGVLLRNGVGSVAVPYAISLHNQFLLPCSNAANTIVSGWGNLRPYQFLIGGIVPALFMLMFSCLAVKFLGESGFPGYLKVSDEDFKYTYKP